MDPGSGSFAAGGTESQPRRIISRSNSFQPLLESAPSSHCVVAAAIGEKPGVSSPGKTAMVAHQHVVEVMMAGRERVAVVNRPEKPFCLSITGDGCGDHGRSSFRGFVGGLFSQKNSSVGAASKEGDTSSQEDEGHDKEGKKKKRSPWLPDPDKRWPIQGFY